MAPGPEVSTFGGIGILCTLSLVWVACWEKFVPPPGARVRFIRDDRLEAQDGHVWPRQTRDCSFRKCAPRLIPAVFLTVRSRWLPGKLVVVSVSQGVLLLGACVRCSLWCGRASPSRRSGAKRTSLHCSMACGSFVALTSVKTTPWRSVERAILLEHSRTPVAGLDLRSA